ncbi:hypothetical protein C8F04DRAFT_1114984 [Mycena alexandri]|uniref:Epoxide hydrolase n=1 Tax=Mycena alexandri TaxID=1745969 RepID=A0AAD6SQJ7_9AGAR|nr:hypothetical protein C8F04DRAFT_1114984 [Mycena alexandri]
MDWTDEDPELDVILESVSLYWFTETIARSFYLYRTAPGQPSFVDDPAYYIQQPFGYSSFAKEITPMPQSWVSTTGSLVFYREHEKGGHFAAVDTGGKDPGT